MKKALKIIFYFSVILLIVFISIEEDSNKRDEVTKVIIEQENNMTEKIEKIKEIQKLIVNAGDDRNITFGEEVRLAVSAKDSDGEIVSYLWKEGNKTLSQEESLDYKFDRGVHHLKVTVTDNEGAEGEDNITINVGYWVLVKVELDGESIVYEYNEEKKIIKKMVDSNEDGKVDMGYYYGYDEKGREHFSAIEYHGRRFDKNISSQFTDDGKLKERNIINHIGGKVDSYINIKIIYNENGDTLKEIKMEKYLDKTEGYEYEKEYYYNDRNQLIEIILSRKDKKFLLRKYEYKDERLVSRRNFSEGQVTDGEDYFYEGEVLKKVQNFGDFWDNSIFYNEEGLVIEKVDSGGRTKYFHNEDGEKIKEEYYEKDSDGEFEQISYTLFDEEKTQKTSLNSDKVETTYKNLYFKNVVIEKRRDVHDKHGNLIEIWDDVANKLIEKRFYQFVI